MVRASGSMVEELVWSGSRGGRSEQFRTAAVFQPSDEGATIANQFGYGARAVSSLRRDAHWHPTYCAGS